MPVIRHLSGHHDEIINLQYLTPEDKLMTLATNSEDVRIVDVEKGFGDVGLLQGHSDIVICLDRDWSGVWLATGGKDNDARLWRIDGEKEEFKCYAKFTGHAESIGAIALARSVPPETSGASKEHRPPKVLITGSQGRTIKRWEVPIAGKKSKTVDGITEAVQQGSTKELVDHLLTQAESWEQRELQKEESASVGPIIDEMDRILQPKQSWG
ncbi:U3 small nucleolar RNA-associated protein 13 [Rhizina undulata]